MSHSYSPAIHSMLCDYEYSIFEKAPDDVERFIREKSFDGINVTIPYKKKVFELCDELSPEALRLGNVNTVVKRPDGSLFGHNTDYYGFCCIVEKSGVDIAGKKAIVLGSGGASGTVCAVLQDSGAKSVTVISRNGENNYENIDRHYDAQVIVNATPIGMYPNNGQRLIELERFGKCEVVFDLIYNPSKTALLLDAERLGIPFQNGLTMLVAQAKAAAECFSGTQIANERIDIITAALERQMKNIVLIGMPGCGKSTIGRMLAQQSGREFIDADACIVAKAGKTIPEIFAECGEEGFRAIETQVLEDICRRSSCIVATGGGCVTVDRNYDIIRQNASVVWIKRDIEALPTDGRPLSQSGKIADMYAKRKPMYERFADFIVENDTTAENAAQEILECIK